MSDSARPSGSRPLPGSRPAVLRRRSLPLPAPIAVPLWLGLLALGLGGCAAMTAPVAGALPDWLPGEGRDGPAFASAGNPITQVAGFWRPTEDTGPDGLPVRGFAGKILLFPAQSRGNEPIAARGSVRVSLYDQTGGRDQLIHQYDLPPDAWQTHLAQSNLGVGYEVFLPYMSDDPRSVRCGLRIRFVPEYEEGVPARPVFSAVETCTLDDARSRRAPGGGRGEPLATRHEMRTETIRPVPVSRPARDAGPAGGVVPASAESAAPTGGDGLDPEMRRRIRAALAKRRRRTAAGPAAPSDQGDAAPIERRRFSLTPADGAAAPAPNPDSPAAHPLLGD